jgi:hypothetical protein
MLSFHLLCQRTRIVQLYIVHLFKKNINSQYLGAKDYLNWCHCQQLAIYSLKTLEEQLEQKIPNEVA